MRTERRPARPRRDLDTGCVVTIDELADLIAQVAGVDIADKYIEGLPRASVLAGEGPRLASAAAGR
jgi:hypothetical protein